MRKSSLLKDAVAVGFGLEVGKMIFHVVGKVIIRTMDEIMKREAEKGYTEARQYCNKWNVNYEDNHETEEVKED